MGRRSSKPPEPPAPPPRPVPPPLFYRDGKRLSPLERGVETAEEVAARAAREKARIDKVVQEFRAARARYPEAERSPFPAWMDILFMLMGAILHVRFQTLVTLTLVVAVAAGFLKTCAR